MKKKAFTLIELLIVVAIIAILAAIAVPNFLEAQVRSKVSRVKADIRSMATAVESYTVDWNRPPPESGNGPGTGPFAPRTIDGFTGQTGIMSTTLSTPIAYLTSSDIRDVFYLNNSSDNNNSRPDVQLFTYKVWDWEWWNRDSSTDTMFFGEGAAMTGDMFLEYYQHWRILSVGPDRDWDNVDNDTHFSTPSPVGLPYDPTNGTISPGSITRSQASSAQTSWLDI
jgi:general secretion pathway protein G